MAENIHVHYSHCSRRPHHITFIERLNLSFFIPFILISASILIMFSLDKVNVATDISFNSLLVALLLSFGRLLVAYGFSLVIGVGLALLALTSPLAERFFLPIYDVIESVPVLVFFPVIIIFFVRYDLLDVAAIFIIFLSMVWNIVFNVVGGIRVIPTNITEVGEVFNIRGKDNLFKIILPSLIPSIVTGSLLAFAQGWNILIVAEVLHSYVPQSTHIGDLFGIGSLLVSSSTSGDQGLFLASVAVIIVSITALNLFVWQRLLRYSGKFRFD